MNTQETLLPLVQSEIVELEKFIALTQEQFELLEKDQLELLEANLVRRQLALNQLELYENQVLELERQEDTPKGDNAQKALDLLEIAQQLQAGYERRGELYRNAVELEAEVRGIAAGKLEEYRLQLKETGEGRKLLDEYLGHEDLRGYLLDEKE